MEWQLTVYVCLKENEEEIGEPKIKEMKAKFDGSGTFFIDKLYEFALSKAKEEFGDNFSHISELVFVPIQEVMVPVKEPLAAKSDKSEKDEVSS